MAAGVYVHIPFCASKCPYCDFYSISFDEPRAEAYRHALLRQWEAFVRAGYACETDSIYFGGGTPSVLPPSWTGSVLAEIIQTAASGSEITIEANPESVTEEKCEQWRRAGFNRISIGVQSLDPAMLRRLGRIHSANQAKNAILAAGKGGFDNVSADLMLGLPGQTSEELSRTLDALLELPLKHVSAYLLKIADGTPFASGVPGGLPEGDEQADLYEQCCEALGSAGFLQYEISNFARPGYESRHNMKYWECADWAGLGPGAHACLAGKRYSFPRDLEKYLQVFSGNTGDPLTGMDFEGTVTPEDYIMLRLRTAAGLDRTQLIRRFGRDLTEEQLAVLAACAEGGLAELDPDCVRLTRRGMLVSNAILVRLI